MFLILCPLLFLVCFFSLWCFFWSCFTISTENVPGWSIPRVPDTLHLHNTDRKNIHWIQMYYTSTFSLPWTLSKVQAPIRTAFHIYTNKDSRDWNISFCLPIGLEWLIRYEEMVGKKKILFHQWKWKSFCHLHVFSTVRVRQVQTRMWGNTGESRRFYFPGACASKTVNTENTEKLQQEYSFCAQDAYMFQ